MKTGRWLVGGVLLAIGFAAGYVVQHRAGSDAVTDARRTDAGREILYWVAPMDPNYRSDRPGKSPMGMDLVPVYADEAVGAGDAVRIDPVVVENLGVRTAVVERGQFRRRIDTVGYVSYDERRISHVHLRTDGWIDRLHVRSVGERVKRGDVLFEIYSRDLVNAQEEFLQALRQGGAVLVAASRERLGSLGMAPPQLAELERTRKPAQRVRVQAVQDGVVARLNVREGMYVTPATEVLMLADLSSVWLLVDVFERQADWVQVGMPAEVTLPYLPGETLEGVAEFVYPSIDPKTRTLRVRLRFDNPDERLKPDMYADVRIHAGPKNDVLSIPREALIRTGDSDRVILALGEGRFRAVEVVPGIESGDRVEIRDGLQEGDRVVVSGQFLIDSEASLKGSLMRMGADRPAAEEGGAEAHAPIAGSGVVEAVDSAARRVTLAHEPIAALGWPAMTMPFDLAAGVDTHGLRAGDRVRFTLAHAPDGTGYEIASIERAD